MTAAWEGWALAYLHAASIFVLEKGMCLCTAISRSIEYSGLVGHASTNPSKKILSIAHESPNTMRFSWSKSQLLSTEMVPGNI